MFHFEGDSLANSSDTLSTDSEADKESFMNYEMDEEAYHQQQAPLTIAASYEVFGTPHEIKIESIDFVQEQQTQLQISLTQSSKVGKSDFELLRVIGKGAYGKVFLVRKCTGGDSGSYYAMKVLRKAHLTLHVKDIHHTRNERTILEEARHPFIVRLYYAFQTDSKLYLILSYAQGGELFTYLERRKMFTERECVFFSGCILLALGHLHSLGIIYRDLKTENVLLDKDGFVLLTDFGLSKVSLNGDERANTVCGTIEYMAPEVLANQPYERSVDWWSLGALMFDMMSGSPPFVDNNRKRTMDQIMNKKLQCPHYFSADAKDICTKLMRKRAVARLGYSEVSALDGVEQLKKHRFFRQLHNEGWRQLLARRIQPPITPVITNPEDVDNFHMDFTSMPVVDTPVAESVMQQPQSTTAILQPRNDAADFGGFSYVASCVLDSQQFEELYQRDFGGSGRTRQNSKRT